MEIDISMGIAISCLSGCVISERITDTAGRLYRLVDKLRVDFPDCLAFQAGALCNVVLRVVGQYFFVKREYITVPNQVDSQTNRETKERRMYFAWLTKFIASLHRVSA